MFVLWCGKTHQCPNISTHLLRLNTPKEEQTKQRNDRTEKNDHPLNPNISKTKKNDQPKHPKYQKKNFPQANKDPRIRTDGAIGILALVGGQRCPNQLAD